MSYNTYTNITNFSFKIKKHYDLDRIALAMQDMEQVDCKLEHIFGEDTYTRQVCLPAGSIVMGYEHTGDNINVMLTGKMLLLDEHGAVQELTAPFACVKPPMRKLAVILEDVVWQNIYYTKERDLQKLEKMYIKKDKTFIAKDDKLWLG